MISDSLQDDQRSILVRLFGEPVAYTETVGSGAGPGHVELRVAGHVVVGPSFNRAIHVALQDVHQEVEL